MEPARRAVPLLAALAGLLLISGCTYVSVETRHYLAVPNYPPTDPALVQILHAPPAKPHERLGEISLEPEGNPSVSEMEAKLRQAAAKIGADAAVIVADQMRIMGAYETGPWWGRTISTQYGRVIIAVAIRYVR
jgi:hypothetical protein